MTPHARLGLAASAAILALTATPASAQRTITGPVLNIGAQIEVRHDTNVARSSAERAAVRGLERSDTRLRPALTIELAKPIGPHDVSLNGLVGYDFYRRNSRLNRERIALDGRGNLRINPCELGLGAGITRQQSQLFDTLVLVDDGPSAIDNTQTVQTYSATLSCGRAIGFRPTVGVTRSTGDNSNPLRGRTNYRSWRYEGGLGYRQPLIGDALLFASRQDVELPDGPVGAALRGYTTDRYGLRYSRDIGARLRGEIEVAFADVSGAGIVGNNYNGPTYNIGLTAAVTPQLQLRALAARDVITNLGNDSAYSLEEAYGLDADYAVNGRLNLSANALIAPRRYYYGQDVLALSQFGLLDNATRTQFGAGAQYSVGPRLRFTLDSGYESRDATGEVFDFSNVYATLGVRLSLR